jgi:hypothetical protein
MRSNDNTDGREHVTPFPGKHDQAIAQKFEEGIFGVPAVILQHRSVPPVQLTPRQQAVADKVREDFAKLEQEAKLRKLDAIEALDRLMDLHGDHLVDIWVTNLLWTRAQIRGEK